MLSFGKIPEKTHLVYLTIRHTLSDKALCAVLYSSEEVARENMRRLYKPNQSPMIEFKSDCDNKVFFLPTAQQNYYMCVITGADY